MFLMMPSTKIAQMVFSTKKGKALDKHDLQMKSPEPLQNQKYFTEMVLMLSSKIDQKVQLG